MQYALPQNKSRKQALIKEHGGEGGIRTPGTLASTSHFECDAIDHSATSPQGLAQTSKVGRGALNSQGRAQSQALLTELEILFAISYYRTMCLLVAPTGVLFATVNWMGETAGPAGWCNVHKRPPGNAEGRPWSLRARSCKRTLDGRSLRNTLFAPVMDTSTPGADVQMALTRHGI